MGTERRGAEAHEPLLIGREIVALSGVGLADLTIELRGAVVLHGRVEASDKHVVEVRVDRRDADGAPVFVSFESGQARQLAAALIRAADLAEDLR